MTAGTIARADEGKNLTHMPMPAAPAIPGECNRECLYGFVDKFFSALESRWPGNMPLAPEVKYTENEVPVALGEGIWKTFSGRGTYRVYLADPASGEAGYYGNYTEFDRGAGRRDRGEDEGEGSSRDGAADNRGARAEAAKRRLGLEYRRDHDAANAG